MGRRGGTPKETRRRTLESPTRQRLVTLGRGGGPPVATASSSSWPSPSFAVSPCAEASTGTGTRDGSTAPRACAVTHPPTCPSEGSPVATIARRAPESLRRSSSTNTRLPSASRPSFTSFSHAASSGRAAVVSASCPARTTGAGGGGSGVRPLVGVASGGLRAAAFGEALMPRAVAAAPRTGTVVGIRSGCLVDGEAAASDDNGRLSGAAGRGKRKRCGAWRLLLCGRPRQALTIGPEK